MKVGQTVIFNPQKPKAHEKRHIGKPFGVIAIYDNAQINIVALDEIWQTICHKSDVTLVAE